MNDEKNNQVTNTNEEKPKNVYSIPGVIIPEQTTDAGVLGSNQTVQPPTAQSSTTQSINQNQPSNTNKEIQLNQTYQYSEAINNNLNQINQSTTNQQPPQVVTVADNTVTVQQPPQKNDSKKKKNKQKDQQNSGGATALTGFLFILVLILSGVIVYFIYNTYFKEKQIIDPVKEWQKKRTVNVDSLVVQELYSYVNLHGCKDQIDFFYDSSRNVVNVSDLSNSTKNYLAYNQLKHSSLTKQSCATYSKALHKNDKDGIWYCGDSDTANNYKDENALTYVINGDKIKELVERIFGPTSYKAETFNIGTSSRYLYDSNTDSYMFQSYYGGTTCTEYENKLSNAYQEGDILTIVVVVTNKVTNNMMKYNYQFKESSNGNYYFTSLNKTEV